MKERKATGHKRTFWPIYTIIEFELKFYLPFSPILPFKKKQIFQELLSFYVLPKNYRFGLNEMSKFLY